MAETDQTNVDYADLIKAQTRQVDIDAFAQRGMKKVNVINARKINELIAQAVTNIISRMEDANIQTIKDDKAQIVQDSMDEFKRLFAEQKKEQEHSAKLQGELEKVREELSRQPAVGGGAQVQSIKDEIAELKAFLTSQAGKAQGSDMTRTMIVEKQAQQIEQQFKEIKEALARGPKAPSEDGMRKALEEALGRITKSLETQDKGRNGAGNEAVMKALGEFRAELAGKFERLASAIKETHNTRSITDSKALKEEIAALRADLEHKTVAVSAMNTQALQAQLTEMQAMLAKGGGGGMGGGDISEIVSKIEGSMSRKLADAGLMKQEVSAEDAISVGSVMVNSAFRDMDKVEANLGNMDARKTKEGGEKAKGALDALKKLKGKK